jgi:phosphate transport system substrate-binding protein
VSRIRTLSAMTLVLTGLVAVMFLMDGCGRKAEEQTYITVKGSDTMVNLNGAWAEAFMKVYPGLQVSVTGGGSGTGIAAMLNGTTDICAASRDMKQKERDLAAEKGITPVELDVALDGIAVMVNKDNPVSELTFDQLRKIFNGTYKSWKNVGGPNQPIIVLSRESNSGTYVFFQEHVLQKDDYAAEALLMPATAAIAQSCAQDKWAIGYGGVGYALNSPVKIIKVKKTDKDEAVFPSPENITSGKYPIARPLHFYTNGQPTGTIKKFTDFVLSPQGQKIVEEMEYVPVA